MFLKMSSSDSNAKITLLPPLEDRIRLASKMLLLQTSVIKV
jgi:hypothetical protein